MDTEEKWQIYTDWCQQNRCYAECISQKSGICEDVRGIKECKAHKMK